MPNDPNNARSYENWMNDMATRDDSALGNCPECGEPELTIDSASPAKQSWIECSLCDFRYQKPMTEDALLKHWKKKQATHNALAQGRGD